MTKNLNITIVSDVPPDISYTAGQVLHQAISGLSEFNFRFYWLNQSNLDLKNNLPGNCVQISMLQFSGGRIIIFLVRGCHYLARRLPFLTRPIVLIRNFINSIPLIFKSIRLGWNLRRDPASIIWFVVQGEILVFASLIASFVAGKPYLLQQWDPLSWWMGHRKRPYILVAISKRVLSLLEYRASVNIIPSDMWLYQMEAEGKFAIRLDNFINKSFLDELSFIALSDSKVFHAVFVGQFYAGHELLHLVKSLTKIVNSLGKELTIHTFGAVPPDHIIGSKVLYHGHIERDELIRRISKWDLALLPYPISAEYEETLRLSFPSKARIYLAAGLPILAYAPVFSGVHQFCSREYAPYYCNLENNDSTNFVRGLVDAGYQERHTRFNYAKNLVIREFSNDSELAPLRNILTGIA